MRIIYADRDGELRSSLFKQIKKDMSAIPEKFSRVLLVVPRQSSFSVEESAIEAIGGKGFLTLNVVSAEKLRHDILRQTGGSGRVPVNSIGRSMVLRRAAKAAAPQLTAFSGVCRDSRFAEMLTDFVVRMKQGALDSADLKTVAESLRQDSLLSRKLSDMSLIVSAYEDALAGTFSDSEDELRYATKMVRESGLIKGARIYYYGFSSFSALEKEFLKALDESSAGVIIALQCGDGMQFECTRKLMSMFSAPAERVSDPEYEKKTPAAEVVRCASPFTQAETLAGRILRLVREEGCRYSDIAVLTPGRAGDSKLIKRVLESVGIPVFMDERRPVLHSSSAEVISALMSLTDGKYRAADVLRFLRSGAIGEAEDDIWIFCNYVKQYHIKGSAFLKPFRYYPKECSPEQKAMLQQLREKLAGLLEPFVNSFASAAAVKDKAAALRSFLEGGLGMPERLEAEASVLAQEGFADASEETRQLWDIVSGILDQMEELLGGEEISCQDFSDMLMGALSDVKVGVLPQAEGRVQIGDISRSMLSDMKAVFITGMCDGLIPSAAEGGGILTDAELDQLTARGVPLAKSSRVRISEEVFMVFRNAGCAQQLFWIGVPSGDQDGEELKPSPLLPALLQQFENVTELNDIENGGNELDLLQGSAMPMEKTAQMLRAGLTGEDVPQIWKAVYNVIREKAPQLKAGLLYKPGDIPLGKDLAKKLYSRGTELSLSPSRLESFAGCPFRHFIDYGLRPYIPREFGIAAAEIGDIYHEALLRLCEQLSQPARQQGIAMTDPASLWMTVTREQAAAMLTEILDRMAEESLDGVMTSSKAEEYRSQRLRTVCLRFAWHMIEQVRAGRIDEMFFETRFGRGGVFAPIVLNTEAGKVYVEGKIDRVDMLPGEAGRYVKIVDYKSGAAAFNKAMIESGLSLQLMTYLEGAIGSSKDKPAGVYYFRISADDIEAAVEDLSAETISDDILAKIDKKYTLNGITVNDDTVLSDIDETLLPTGKTKVIEVSRGKDGLKGSLISPEDMDSFRKSFRAMLTSAAESLAMGEITASGRKFGTVFDACRYCSYSGICLKDVRK